MFILDNFIIEKLILLPGIIIGFAFHEFAHALASDRLGDPTPRNQGRLTISPTSHIDPIGLLLILFAGFGWARPVQTNPRHYRNPRRDDIIVSAAGSAMNLLLSFVFAGILKIYITFNLHTLTSDILSHYIVLILLQAVSINILLFVFNLLPIPPLDGFHILKNFIPINKYHLIYNLERYSTIILLLFIISPLSDIVLRSLISPISEFILDIFNLFPFIYQFLI
jgi:Zn-dependent protease